MTKMGALFASCSFFALGLLCHPVQEQGKLDQQQRMQDRLDQQLIKRNLSLGRVLEFLLEHPDRLEEFEVPDYQRKQISEIVKEYNEQIELLKKSEEAPEEVSRQKISLEFKKTKAVREVLVKDQLLALTETGIYTSGLVKVLANSPVGEALNLTDQQRNRIKEKSNRLALEIRDFIHYARKEARGIVIDELNIEQERLVNQVYSKRVVDYYMREVEILTLYEHLLFDPPEDLEDPRFPAQALRKTIFDR